MPQWALIGRPGQTGQVSLAALPQTVNTKSRRGAPAPESSFQLLLRKPSSEWLPLRSISRASGWTAPFGWLPALKARKRPPPPRWSSASAMMPRAELPVQRNRTLWTLSAMSPSGSGAVLGPGGLLDETIAQSDHGLDVVAGGAELQAQAPDGGVDAPRLHLALVAPPALEQPLTGQDAPRPLDHEAEELELLVGQADLLAPIAHDVRVELHLEVLVPVPLRGLARGTGPAQGHSAARGQLFQAERLHHVVVGPHLEAEDAVHLVGAGRHNDDGDVGGHLLAPDHPADLQAVHARQVQVEQHQVDAAAHRLQPLLARAGHLDLEPDLLELIADRFCDVVVVLDQHHPPAAVRKRQRSRNDPSGPVRLHLASAS